VVSAPFPPGRELELLNLVLTKHVLPKHLPKDIVVLSLRGAGKESYAGAAELAGLKAEPFDPAKPYEEGTIRTSTVFKFKGMESHVVVLADLDKLDSTRDRRRAYVGMSRVRTRGQAVTPQVLILNELIKCGFGFRETLPGRARIPWWSVAAVRWLLI
jgi:hypothetical protein